MVDRRRIRTRMFRWQTVVAAAALCALPGDQSRAETRDREFVVSTVNDGGPGSLRVAIESANARTGSQRIVFGPAEGLFSSPRTIELDAPLPTITGDLNIDGRIDGVLWKAYGATISGAGHHRVFEVAPGARLRLTGLTIANGAADRGAGILNRGWLALDGVSLIGNRAGQDGGALDNADAVTIVVNSTATGNVAARGGAIANIGGQLRVTHGTLYENQALTGSDLFNAGRLTLVNSILAGATGERCINLGAPLDDSSHNLITSHRGCGDPLLSSDPRLEKLDYYNGPTQTLALGGGSPAVNLADRSVALDVDGKPLEWDQRGNGDPRFAGGYADLGAFEQQPPNPTELLVDTLADNGLRGCSVAGAADCPLRAALELAAVAGYPITIRFSSDIFHQAQTLVLPANPPGAGMPLVLDGAGAAPVTISAPGARLPWQLRNGVRLQLRESPRAQGELP